MGHDPITGPRKVGNTFIASLALLLLSSCEPVDVSVKFSATNLTNQGEGPYNPKPEAILDAPAPTELQTPRPGTFAGEPSFIDTRCIERRRDRCYLAQPIKFVEPLNTLNSGASPMIWSSPVWGTGPGPLIGTTNGADIPSFAQPIVGGRYAPDHLRAAILHDHYTYPGNRTRSFDATQRAFYYMLRADGKPQVQAMLMYYAVFTFGEKWIQIDPNSQCSPFLVEGKFIPSGCPDPRAKPQRSKDGTEVLARAVFPRRQDIEQMEREFLAAQDLSASKVIPVSNLPGSLGWRQDLKIIEAYIAETHKNDPVVMGALNGMIELTPELMANSSPSIEVVELAIDQERFKKPERDGGEGGREFSGQTKKDEGSPGDPAIGITK